MQPSPILSQQGLSLPIIAISQNPPPPIHLVSTLTPSPPSNRLLKTLTPSVTLHLAERTLVNPINIETTSRGTGQFPIDCTFTAFENKTRIKRSSSMPCLNKNNSTYVDYISLFQFDCQSGQISDCHETKSIKTQYNNPPNSPTRKHSALTQTPSCQPNRPLTSLPHLMSIRFQSIPLVTITPAPGALKNPIPIEVTPRKLNQGPSEKAKQILSWTSTFNNTF